VSLGRVAEVQRLQNTTWTSMRVIQAGGALQGKSKGIGWIGFSRFVNGFVF
jgi:hypothetical protein